MREVIKRIKLDEIILIHNYRDYETIWVYSPSAEPSLHIGYMDGTFFAYILANMNNEDPYSIIDYYIDKVYFKVESVEKDLVTMNSNFRCYKNALDSKIKMFSKL